MTRPTEEHAALVEGLRWLRADMMPYGYALIAQHLVRLLGPDEGPGLIHVLGQHIPALMPEPLCCAECKAWPPTTWTDCPVVAMARAALAAS